MVNIDCIVVGSGLWGCTIARILAEHGNNVLILEKRKHNGGNSRCHIDSKTGIEVHDYGCHIFHTNNEAVWNFINRFTSFNQYTHKCLAFYNNKHYYLPFGLSLINSFYNINLKPSEVQQFIKNEVLKSKTYIGNNPDLNFETKAISLIGKKIYDAFIKGYTKKQWNCDPTKLPSDIIKRIPVRDNYDLNYYNDGNFQGLPLNGYEKLFNNMLSHPRIKIENNIDYNKWKLAYKNIADCTATFYSGPIDELFDYKFGELQWRSLNFEFETLNKKDFQGTSIINYPDESIPYTRILEFKHFHPENKDLMNSKYTIICREHPLNYKKGLNPYYPINNKSNSELFLNYKNELKKKPNIIIGGRLGNYKYYNMDETVANAIKIVNYFINN